MIIGSQAILYHFPDFPRKPKDVDIIKNMYIEGYMSHLKIEWLENTVLQNWCSATRECISSTVIPPRYNF